MVQAKLPIACEGAVKAPSLNVDCRIKARGDHLSPEQATPLKSREQGQASLHVKYLFPT